MSLWFDFSSMEKSLGGNIHIRTASLSPCLQNCLYYAGGGITLLSTVTEEFHERMVQSGEFSKSRTPVKEK